MKKILLVLSVFYSLNIEAQVLDCSELFFSEYVEGYSQNKALEIYNPTNTSIDLSDYRIERYSNGSTNSSAGGITILSGMIDPGDVFVITNGETDTSGQFGYCDPVLMSLGDFAEPNGSYPTPLHMNGNDALVLTKNGAILDVIGRIGEDPSSGAWTNDPASGFQMGSWWTANHTLIRKSWVDAGDKDGLDLFDPSVQWDSLPVGCWDNLGEHTCDCTPNQVFQLKLCAPIPSSISPINNHTHVIYPNPVNQGSYVNINSRTEIKNITVIDMMGRQHTFLNRINTTKFSKGVYILFIRFNDGIVKQHKLIVQ